MSREYGNSHSHSHSLRAMKLPKALSSSTSMMDRKPLSPAAAYAKWASREMTQRTRCMETNKEVSQSVQKSAAKVAKPKLVRLAPRQVEQAVHWEGSSPTPSVTFLPKSQLWPEEMPEMIQRPAEVDDEPPQVRAPPPSPRLRNLDLNQKAFSRLFDDAVATTKRRQQHANAGQC